MELEKASTCLVISKESSSNKMKVFSILFLVAAFVAVAVECNSASDSASSSSSSSSVSESEDEVDLDDGGSSEIQVQELDQDLEAFKGYGKYDNEGTGPNRGDGYGRTGPVVGGPPRGSRPGPPRGGGKGGPPRGGGKGGPPRGGGKGGPPRGGGKGGPPRGSPGGRGPGGRGPPRETKPPRRPRGPPRETKPPRRSHGCIGTCPRRDPIHTSIYLRNRDCHKFCECSNGRAIVLDCPRGLHFNPRLNVCDWPWKARCHH